VGAQVAVHLVPLHLFIEPGFLHGILHFL
jgi:hypothetical protein